MDVGLGDAAALAVGVDVVGSDTAVAAAGAADSVADGSSPSRGVRSGTAEELTDDVVGSGAVVCEPAAAVSEARVGDGEGMSEGDGALDALAEADALTEADMLGVGVAVVDDVGLAEGAELGPVEGTHTLGSSDTVVIVPPRSSGWATAAPVASKPATIAPDATIDVIRPSANVGNDRREPLMLADARQEFARRPKHRTRVSARPLHVSIPG